VDRYVEYKNGTDLLPRIPTSWTVKPLKYAAALNLRVLLENTNEEAEINYIDIGSVEYGKGIVNIQEYTFANAPSRARRIVYEGDTIISTVRTYLKAVAYISKDYDGFVCSTGFAVFTPKAEIDRKFFSYALLDFGFISDVERHSVGVSYPAITSSVLASLKAVFPPSEEQAAIATYLDRRTAGIDDLLADLTRQAEMLDTYKRELVAEAVSKGLDKSVAMRDSGVDWIGGIPAHWKTRRIKYLYELRQERNFLPLADVELISLYTNLGVVKHSDLEKTTGNKAQNADGYKHVYKNDIVVNIILCWMGAIGLSDYNGVTSPAYDVYKPKVDMVCSKYYHYLFRTSKFCGECFKVGRGIMMMRWRTYSDQFKAITVQLPPIAEQERIATYLDTKTAQVESLIADIKAQIEKLKQYRQIVIHDAVTGNIKVTEG